MTRRPDRWMLPACFALVLFAVGPACSVPAGKPDGKPAAKPKPTRRWDAQYKRLHRDQITQLVAGRADAAIAWGEAHLADYPDDLESHYLLAVAYARRGDVATAMRHVEQAVAGGMAFGRFLAGPRGLLRPLTQSDAFREFAERRPTPLIHGPMIGAVTDSGARVWVRTAREATVELVVRRLAKGAPAPVRAQGRTRAADDYTAVIDVAGLEPDAPYGCEVFIDGRKVPTEAPPLRTFPKAGSPAKFEVAFGGGAGYTPEHERMWDTVAERRPLALLLLGDNVYIDTPKVPETQRYCYYRRQSRPEFRRLAGSTAVYAIWDDHDFAANDCMHGPLVDDPPWKPRVWRVFRENWVNPSYGGGDEQPGCWFRFGIGDVDFFMLDCRYYRDLKGNPPSMLGPVQKAWLKAALAGSKAAFKVIASSVPWAYGAKPGSKDPWQGYREEREELLAFLADRRIDGVLLLSADRHRSDLWKIDRPAGYPLYEFESSRLTNIHTHPVMKGSLYGYNKTCSFGALEFDTTARDPEVAFRIVAIDGRVVHTFRLKASDLAHGS